MKILLANYRYFLSGGPERYLFNLKRLLEENGHSVAPFSIAYTKNEQTPYAQYFVSPLGTADEVRFSDQRRTLRTFARTLRRLFYDSEVAAAVTRLIAETGVETAYVLHYLRKLSPALLVGIKRARLPLVVRISDYGMLCPQAHMLRNGVVCDLCLKTGLLPSIRHRCVQGSVLASITNAIATRYHQAKAYFDLIDAFVLTNDWMLELMLRQGYAPERLHVIPTFVDGRLFHPRDPAAKGNYLAYVGRLEQIKGAHLVIEALHRLRKAGTHDSIHLKIAGHGRSDYVNKLHRLVEELNLAGAVEFLGNLDGERLVTVLNGALASIVPSLWYENLPNSLLESYACGTAVLAPRHGCFMKCLRDGDTGLFFAAGDAADLARVLAEALSNPQQLLRMGSLARKEAEHVYSPETHLNSLLGLFNEVAQRYRSRTSAPR